MVVKKNSKKSSIFIKLLIGICLGGFLFGTTTVFALPAFPADEGVYIFEEKSGDVIYEQNATNPFSPASTTKLMTALVLVNNVPDLNEVITVGDEVNDYGYQDSRAGLWQGQQLRYLDLLYAMLLPSGNDAAGTISINVGRKLLGDPNADRHVAQQRFVDEMNNTLKALGLYQSHFMNPSGVQDDNHYVTPRDMAVIAKNAFANPSIFNAAGTKTYELKAQNGLPYQVYNTDLLLYGNAAEIGRVLNPQAKSNDPASVNLNPYASDLVKAGKTGTGLNGEKTFVFKSKLGDSDVIGVLFKTVGDQTFVQTKSIVEELNGTYSLVNLTDEQGTFDTVEIANAHFLDGNTLTVQTNGQVSTYIPNAQNGTLKSETRWDPNYLKADSDGLNLVTSIEAGDKIGARLIKDQNGKTLKSIPLYAENSLGLRNWQDDVKENIWYLITASAIVLVLLIGIIQLFIHHRRKKRFKKEFQKL